MSDHVSILHPELEDQMLRFFLRLATTESRLSPPPQGEASPCLR